MENTERRRPPSAQHETNRSTARSHYRRTTAPASKRDIREKILLQIIVSASLLLIVLVMNIVDIEPLREVRLSLKTALGQNVTAEDLKDDLQNAGDYAASLQDTVLTIFGEEPSAETNLNAEAAEENNTELDKTVTRETDFTQEDNEDLNFRLDEEMLGISKESQAEDLQTKNTQTEDGAEEKKQ